MLQWPQTGAGQTLLLTSGISFPPLPFYFPSFWLRAETLGTLSVVVKVSVSWIWTFVFFLMPVHISPHTIFTSSAAAAATGRRTPSVAIYLTSRMLCASSHTHTPSPIHHMLWFVSAVCAALTSTVTCKWKSNVRKFWCFFFFSCSYNFSMYMINNTLKSCFSSFSFTGVQNCSDNMYLLFCHVALMMLPHSWSKIMEIFCTLHL